MSHIARNYLHAAPVFAEPLHVGRPNIGSIDAIQRRIQDILERRWLSNDGIMVQEFECRVAQIAGVRHCIAVCNATLGLELLARAAELTGEVIVPANTFVATAHALEWVGLTPVFCDIDPQTHNLDPAHVEQAITPRTSAIVGVHVWGRPCCPPALTAIAARHGLQLFFDAAHAFGCSADRRMIGGHGRAEVFSFHATKFVSCGEGGAIATSDDELAARLRRMRSFGLAGCDHVVGPGTNAKMSEFAAAMGLSSLEAMPQFVAANRRNYECYRRALANVPGVRLVEYVEAETNNYQYLVLEIDPEVSPLTRDQWLQVLHAENILARRYFYPGVHRMEPYASRDPRASQRLPATESLLGRVLVLPTGTAVGPADIDLIGSVFARAIEAAARIRSRLSPTLPLPTVTRKAA